MRRDALRAKVPEAHRAEFDQWLEEARFIHRLRDERGMYNDCLGLRPRTSCRARGGPAPRGRGVLPDAALAISASHEEIVSLLKGGKEPSVEELRRRQDMA